MVKLYSVGGYVRDKLLGRISNDLDYAVEADSFEDMHNYIIANNFHIFLEKPEFFTIRAMSKKSKKTIDFTLCRTDGQYSDYRRPDKCEIGNIYQDLSRRDLTINAIAIDENGNIIDPYNGKEDIDNRIIRCVGNVRERITEDPLRILRALRFAVILGFTINDDLETLLHEDSVVKLLKHISIERKIGELTKMFKYDTIKSIEILTKYNIVAKYTFINGLWMLPTNKKI